MGTRHLTCVKVDCEYKVAQYGQWDGYPSGQGKTIRKFLHEMDRAHFEERVGACIFVSHEEITRMYEEFGAANGMIGMEDSKSFLRTYPELHRDTGAEVLRIIYDNEGVIKLGNNIDFAGDSLFCEWAYVIDLDDNTFEVFVGFNQEPLSKDDRFYAQTKKHNPTKDDGYQPVKLFVSYDLDDLPSMGEFLAYFTLDGGYDDK